MRNSDYQKYDKRVVQHRKRVDRQEWDFTKVPPEEEQGCCIYEYARESKWIMEEVDNPAEEVLHGCPQPDKEAIRKNKLAGSLLIYALPPVRHINEVGQLVGRQKSFDGRPWLAQEPKWRQEYCQKMEKYKDRVDYARILEKKPDQAFCLGIRLPFPWRRWEKEHKIRILDQETGLEAMVMTVDWRNFKDSEIIKQFRKWLKSKDGRPKDLGLRTGQGKRTDAWRKKLERLAILRLRHYYPVDEMSELLPDAWVAGKFTDIVEIERERKAARRTLLELFPFLPEDTKPVNWAMF